MPRYTAIIEKGANLDAIIKSIESAFNQSDVDRADSVDYIQDPEDNVLTMPKDFWKSTEKYQIKCFFPEYRARPHVLSDIMKEHPGVVIFEEGEGKLFGRPTRNSSISLRAFGTASPPTGKGTHVIVMDTPITDSRIQLATTQKLYPSIQQHPHGNTVALTILELAPETTFHSIEYVPSSKGPSVLEAMAALEQLVLDLEAKDIPLDLIVVNMSWGLPRTRGALDAFDDGFTRVFGVAAAGNGDTCVGSTFPACVKSVMTVGAIDGDVYESAQSSPGPGADIFISGKVQDCSGTSFAAARITGLALQAKSMYQQLNVAQTRQFLLSSAAHDVHMRQRSVTRARTFR